MALTVFPNEDEKEIAISFIYDRLGRIADALGQYVDSIVYETAAIGYGGITNNEHLICYGYYKLKQYDQAVRSCTEIIGKTNNLLAYYWRGQAFRESDQKQAALRDLKVVADSTNGFSDAVLKIT